MGKREDNLKLAEEWVEAMNRHDAELLGSFCTEDANSRELAEPKPVKGREEIVKAYRELFEGFPDCSTRIVNRAADEGCVLLEVLWEGTNEGKFRGVQATLRKAKLPIAYVFEFKGGKVQKIREYYDAATYLTQMGLMPAP